MQSNRIWSPAVHTHSEHPNCRWLVWLSLLPFRNLSPLEINANCSNMRGRGKTAVLLQSLRPVTPFVKGLHALQHHLWGADPSSGPAATGTVIKSCLQAHLPLLGFYIIHPGLKSTLRRCCGHGWVWLSGTTARQVLPVDIPMELCTISHSLWISQMVQDAEQQH